MLKDWKKGFEGNQKVTTLRAEVEAFASGFDMPAFTAASVDI